jgi:hypothetical protein
VHGALSRRERLDCRQCSVICEQVVSPWRCLATQHGCVYAYEEGENTYFGCLHKIFSPELDMAAFAGGGPPTTLGDPYGALRVVRTPRPQCPVTVERAYAAMQSRERCVNLAFGDPQGANGIMELQERDAEGRDGRQGRRGSAG